MDNKDITFLKKLLLKFDTDILIESIINFFAENIKCRNIKFYRKEKQGFRLIIEKDKAGIKNTSKKDIVVESDLLSNIHKIQVKDNIAYLPLQYKNKILAIISIELSKSKNFKVARYSDLTEFLSAIYYYSRIYEFATKDPLTRIFNKRYFMYKSNEILDESIKQDKEFAVLMLDIDHFKHYNDKYGHQIGDIILINIVNTVDKTISQYDTLFARYGGEEFIIMIKEKNPVEVFTIAETIRKAVKQLKIHNESYFWRMTISLGISLFPAHGTSIGELIKKADIALYESKKNGRNKTTLYNE